MGDRRDYNPVVQLRILFGGQGGSHLSSCPKFYVIMGKLDFFLQTEHLTTTTPILAPQ